MRIPRRLAVLACLESGQVEGVRERDFLQAVVDLARGRGWLAYHPFDSRKSAPGYPDLTLCRPPKLLLIELKVGARGLTESQRLWLQAMHNCGMMATVWRPSDWPTIKRILSEE